MRRLEFCVPLRFPVGGVVERTGYLIEGEAGWGECSPLPSWSAREREAAAHAAAESASRPFPAGRDVVEVNAMVPRLDPARAASLAVESGCATIKVKVGDADGEARVRAVRDALPSARIRLDANGAWDFEQAERALDALARYDVEFVEDPVRGLEEMASLRRRTPVPVAAEASVRTIEDARRLRRIGAADVVVLKPQRLGGIAAALDAAQEAGVPAVASSALETSVGLAAVVALAAALPASPFAHGCGTAILLARDVVRDPLAPDRGRIAPRRPEVSLAELSR